MNYTKTVREYCKLNPDSLFDISYMISDYFSMIPYKTLLKILNRLEDEGIVFTVAKGVYYIGEKEGFDLDSAIYNYYIDKGNGMYYGYKMLNELDISDYKSPKTELYTSKIGVEHKTIGNYSLTRKQLYFDEEVKDLITVLELINIGLGMNIEYFNLIACNEAREIRYKDYLDWVITNVMKETDYSYSVWVTLDEKLRERGINKTSLNEHYNYRR